MEGLGGGVRVEGSPTQAGTELGVGGHLQVGVGDADGQLGQRHGRHSLQVVGGRQDAPLQDGGLLLPHWEQPPLDLVWPGPYSTPLVFTGLVWSVLVWSGLYWSSLVFTGLV